MVSEDGDKRSSMMEEEAEDHTIMEFQKLVAAASTEWMDDVVIPRDTIFFNFDSVCTFCTIFIYSTSILCLSKDLRHKFFLFLSNSIVRDAASDSPQIQFDMVAVSCKTI
eukprot:scaffold785_cov301-Chaetoceros_neogracile.AAC.7